MAANPRITQAQIGRELGLTQAWVSKYKLGTQDADIDQLDAMARVYGHTLMELLDLQPAPTERELLEAYRAVVAEKRPLVVNLVKAMAGVLEPPRRRKRTP